ncbi:MAG: outer membrane beta-barrel protein [Terracidiphilus sp.]|jgi:hypothetical protein
MRRFAFLLSCILLAAGAVSAQVTPSATARQLSVTAGGMVSIFQPDFEGDWDAAGQPIAEASSNALFGAGGYVDLRLSRWVQLEAEGRWLRFNQYSNIHEDNYLAGPRLPVYRFRKATVYGKVLGGFSKMTFDSYGDHGRFTALAFGGGMDVKVTRRLSIRALDVEYQYWPEWGNSTLSPYGASVGVGYRIF